MRLFVPTACLACVMLGSSSAQAFSPAKPRRHDVFSPNGAFVLDVDPGNETNTVYATADRSRPLWSFREHIWLAEVLVSNDGTVVAVLQWRYVREDDLREVGGIWFHNKGGIFKVHSVAELCPNPRRTSDVGPGPVGDFWRTWYTDVTNTGERFVLYTTGWYDYELRFSDGEVISKRWHWNIRMPRIVRENPILATLVGLYCLLLVVLGLVDLRRRWNEWRASKARASPSGT